MGLFQHANQMCNLSKEFSKTQDILENSLIFFSIHVCSHLMGTILSCQCRLLAVFVLIYSGQFCRYVCVCLYVCLRQQ